MPKLTKNDLDKIYERLDPSDKPKNRETWEYYIGFFIEHDKQINQIIVEFIIEDHKKRSEEYQGTFNGITQETIAEVRKTLTFKLYKNLIFRLFSTQNFPDEHNFKLSLIQRKIMIRDGGFKNPRKVYYHTDGTEDHPLINERTLFNTLFGRGNRKGIAKKILECYEKIKADLAEKEIQETKLAQIGFIEEEKRETITEVEKYKSYREMLLNMPFMREYWESRWAQGRAITQYGHPAQFIREFVKVKGTKSKIAHIHTKKKFFGDEIELQDGTIIKISKTKPYKPKTNQYTSDGYLLKTTRAMGYKTGDLKWDIGEWYYKWKPESFGTVAQNLFRYYVYSGNKDINKWEWDRGDRSVKQFLNEIIQKKGRNDSSNTAYNLQNDIKRPCQWIINNPIFTNEARKIRNEEMTTSENNKIPILTERERYNLNQIVFHAIYEDGDQYVKKYDEKKAKGKTGIMEIETISIDEFQQMLITAGRIGLERKVYKKKTIPIGYFQDPKTLTIHKISPQQRKELRFLIMILFLTGSRIGSLQEKAKYISISGALRIRWEFFKWKGIQRKIKVKKEEKTPITLTIYDKSSGMNAPNKIKIRENGVDLEIERFAKEWSDIPLYNYGLILPKAEDESRETNESSEYQTEAFEKILNQLLGDRKREELTKKGGFVFTKIGYELTLAAQRYILQNTLKTDGSSLYDSFRDAGTRKILHTYRKSHVNYLIRSYGFSPMEAIAHGVGWSSPEIAFKYYISQEAIDTAREIRELKEDLRSDNDFIMKQQMLLTRQQQTESVLEKMDELEARFNDNLKQIKEFDRIK